MLQLETFKIRSSYCVFMPVFQLIFDLLYGQNTNTKLKVYAIEFIHHMCLQWVGSFLELSFINCDV